MNGASTILNKCGKYKFEWMFLHEQFLHQSSCGYHRSDHGVITTLSLAEICIYIWSGPEDDLCDRALSRENSGSLEDGQGDWKTAICTTQETLPDLNIPKHVLFFSNIVFNVSFIKFLILKSLS